MTHTDKFLISELQRFVLDNSRSPRAIDMQGKFGYPGCNAYRRVFGTWNNSLLSAGLELNQYQDHWQDGTETCDKCGKLKKSNKKWYYKKGGRLCEVCYYDIKCRLGKLSQNTTRGKAFKDEIIVRKALDIEKNCNITVNMNASFDLYDKKFGKINVKSSKRTVVYNKQGKQYLCWSFNLRCLEKPDIFICLAYNENRTEIIKVWNIPKSSDIVKNKKQLTIYDTITGTEKLNRFNINVENFNIALNNINWNDCNVLKGD